MKTILVVDDDSTFCVMLKSYLSKYNFEVFISGTVNNALNLLSKNSFDIILSDYRLPDKTGLELLEALKQKQANIPIIIMTSYGDIRLAVKAMKIGAFDYITKPVNPSELLELVKSALQLPLSKPTLISKDTKNTFQFVEGVSESWKKINDQIRLVGPTGLSVIIQGESGTGKEFVARKIHELSNRSQGPFIAIDCGALSAEMANSELFGHIKGAFTGAGSDKEGQFESATGGTLFLDEIGNLSYDIQIKLLRAIQERIIRRTGATKNIEIDVRIIVASNEDLVKAVKEGSFREDLYHRLNEFKIEVAALRDRKEDIPVFADSFLLAANNELTKSITGFDEDVIEKLTGYSWPGNLRELKNVIRRSTLLAKGNKININCLPSEILVSVPASGSMSKPDTTNLKILSENMEKETILNALRQARNNKSKAAKLLNIDRKTLYNKLRDYGMDL